MLKKSSLTKGSFGVLEKAMNYVNGNSHSFLKLANSDPKRFESPFPVNQIKPEERLTQVTKLSNGVRIVTETPSLPGPVTLGVLLETGTSNETKDSSGALFSIKSTYYKSNLNTNETINYGMVQMSGGKYDMNYDRERTLFKASCLSHDVSDIFAMMSDCVLEPRSQIAANAAISKMKYQRKVEAVKNPGQDDTDSILSQAFGHHGLGMPILGYEKNTENLNAFTLQKFQIENFSPERIIIAGVGVENHGEFVSLVEDHWASIRYGSRQTQKIEQAFSEFELRTVDPNSHKNDIYLVFESVASSHEDMIKACLTRELFGSADVGNPNNQETNFGLFVGELYNKEKSVYAAECFNLHFNNSGLLGFRLNTSGEASNKTIEALTKVVHSLDKLTEKDLVLAKKRLTRKVLEATADDYLRVGEILNHQSIFGENKLQNMLKAVEAVNVHDLSGFIRGTLRNKAGLFVKGSHPSSVYGLGKIKELLK